MFYGSCDNILAPKCTKALSAAKMTLGTLSVSFESVFDCKDLIIHPTNSEQGKKREKNALKICKTWGHLNVLFILFLIIVQAHQ